MDNISYRKSLAFWKMMGSLLFVVVCILLVLIVFWDRDISKIQIFFCISSAMLGIPFFGGYLVASAGKWLRKDTRLLMYDEHQITDGVRSVSWSAIARLDYRGASFRKWMLPRFPAYIFHLKDGSRWEVSTYYMLNDEEFASSIKLLRSLISRNRQRSKK